LEFGSNVPQVPLVSAQAICLITAMLGVPQHSSDPLQAFWIGTQAAVIAPCAETEAMKPCKPGISHVTLPTEVVAH